MNDYQVELTETEAKEGNKQPRKLLRNSVIGVIVTGVLGFYNWQLHDGIVLASSGDDSYQKYVSECQVYLERAEVAGDAKTTLEQMVKATKWLDKNYPTNSFESQEVKKDIDYLKQHQTGLAPESIKRSINYSQKSIDKFEDEKRESTAAKLNLVLFGPFTVFVAGLFLLALFIYFRNLCELGDLI